MAKAQQPAKDAAKEFLIEQIFVDKTSFAAPVPVYRLNKEWKPNANLDLDVKVNEQGKDGLYEVALIIKVSVLIDLAIGEEAIDEHQVEEAMKRAKNALDGVVGDDPEEMQALMMSIAKSEAMLKLKRKRR